MKTSKKGNLVSKIKKVAPFALFMVPGGAAFGLWYVCANQQAEMTNAMNMAIAEAEAEADRQEFLTMLNGISANDVAEASETAYNIADKAAAEVAMQEALGSNGVDWDKYYEVYYREYNEIFDDTMLESLGLTEEQGALLADLGMSYKENGENVWNGEFNAEIGDAVAQKWGYESLADLQQSLSALVEAANNGDETAMNTLITMDRQFSIDAFDYASLDPMKEYAANSFVDNNFVAEAMGEVTVLNVMGDTLGMGAVALGLTAVAAGAAYLVSRSGKSKDDSATMEK